MLMCGLLGAGETTSAHEPASTRMAVRPGPDERLDSLGIGLRDS